MAIEIDKTTAKEHLNALTKEAGDDLTEATYVVNKQRKKLFEAEKRLATLQRLPKKGSITSSGIFAGPDVFCSFTADMKKAEEDVELLNKELEVFLKEQADAEKVSNSLMTSRRQLKAFSDAMRLEAEIPKLYQEAEKCYRLSCDDFRQAWEQLKYLSKSQGLTDKAEDKEQKLALALAVFED